MIQNIHIDWRQVHRWWSTWGLGLQAALSGLYAAWDAFQDVLPLGAFVGGSIGLSVLVWGLSHIPQASIEDGANAQ